MIPDDLITGIIYFACAAILTGALLNITERFLLTAGMGRKNFRGEVIPCGTGLLFVTVSSIILVVDRHHFGTSFIPFILVTIGFGVLGFLDDRFGTREIGGFKGHFRALLKEHRLTTGNVKALGGGALALGVGWYAACDQLDVSGMYGVHSVLHPELLWLVTLLNAGLIALFANTINLLDTRPGRALKVWGSALLLLAVGCLAVRGHMWGFGMVLAVFGGSAAAYAFHDLKAKTMMGDVGSNTLGAALGLACATDLGLAAKIVVLALLIAFNLFCEKYSVSKLLERRKAGVS